MSDKKRILVIDDEPDFVSIVQANLEKEGFDVEVAYDGVEGLQKVKANPPDAIVLDVIMPEKDGYEVCAELKADPRYADIPIVMEAEDYLPKPASAKQIMESVKRLLNL